jgi:hypothetical protein
MIRAVKKSLPLLLVWLAFAAQAQAPTARSAGAPSPPPALPSPHCTGQSADAKHRDCDRDCVDQSQSGQLPGDLSEMLEEHFLSVQAEPQTQANTKTL